MLGFASRILCHIYMRTPVTAFTGCFCPDTYTQRKVCSRVTDLWLWTSPWPVLDYSQCGTLAVAYQPFSATEDLIWSEIMFYFCGFGVYFISFSIKNGLEHVDRTVTLGRENEPQIVEWSQLRRMQSQRFMSWFGRKTLTTLLESAWSRVQSYKVLNAWAVYQRRASATLCILPLD